MKILVIIPTLDRPGKLRSLAENILSATASQVHVLFVVEGEDVATCLMAAELAQDGLAGWCANRRKKNFSGAYNSGYQLAAHSGTHFTHAFVGADDLRFAIDWDMPLQEPAEHYAVVGTNDLHNGEVLGKQLATAYLVDRRYIDEVGGVIDQPPGLVQCEEYAHNYTDTEFIGTARSRGVWTPCLDSVVEHMHPVWGRGEWDPGYARSMSGIRADSVVYEARRHLWEGPHASIDHRSDRPGRVLPGGAA